MLDKTIFDRGIFRLTDTFGVRLESERNDFFFEELNEISENQFNFIINRIIKEEPRFPQNLVNAFVKFGFERHQQKTEENNDCEYCDGHGVVIAKLERWGKMYDTALPCPRCPQGSKVNYHLANPDPKIYPQGRKPYRKEDFLAGAEPNKPEEKAKRLVFVDIVKGME